MKQMERLGSSELADIDQLDELVDWNLSFRQLECGPFEGSLDVLHGSDLVTMRVDFNRRLHQVGEPPPGMKCFAIVDPGPNPLDVWCGKPFRTGDLVDFNDPCGFDGVSQGGLGAYTVGLSEDLLERKANELGVNLRDCFGSGRSGSLAGREDSDRDPPRALLHHAFTTLDRLDPASRAHMGEKLADELATHVLLATHRPVHSAKSTPDARQRLCRRAIDYINSNLQFAVGVAELCRACDTSIATLQRAFRDSLGITPKRYINYARLGAAHRDLLRARTGTVTDIAGRYGFWHMSQFARDYRAFTGQKPSETLAIRMRSQDRLTNS